MGVDEGTQAVDVPVGEGSAAGDDAEALDGKARGRRVRRGDLFGGQQRIGGGGEAAAPRLRAEGAVLGARPAPGVQDRAHPNPVAEGTAPDLVGARHDCGQRVGGRLQDGERLGRGGDAVGKAHHAGALFPAAGRRGSARARLLRTERPPKTAKQIKAKCAARTHSADSR